MKRLYYYLRCSKNAATGDYETITLVETGVNTGIFRNTTPLASSSVAGLGPNDSTLNGFAGNSLSVSYTDPIYGETATAAATINAPVPSKILYLSTDGVGSPDQDLKEAAGHHPEAAEQPGGPLANAGQHPR